MRLRRLVFGVATAALVAVPSAAQAQLAIDFTSPTTDFTNGAWSLGWQFDVVNPLTVTQLGFYDDRMNGLAESHDIGIYDSFGTLLASTTIAAGGGTLSGWFRMQSIGALNLGVGTGYVIAATTGGENYTWNPNGFTVDPNIVFVGDRFESSTTLVFPTTGPGSMTGWFGPNFSSTVSAVPEPGTYALVATGLVALAGFARRRRAA